MSFLPIEQTPVPSLPRMPKAEDHLEVQLWLHQRMGKKKDCSQHRDLNTRPEPYESTALPYRISGELYQMSDRARVFSKILRSWEKLTLSYVGSFRCEKFISKLKFR